MGSRLSGLSVRDEGVVMTYEYSVDGGSHSVMSWPFSWGCKS